MPKFWKVILGFVGFFVGIILILVTLVIIRGGSLTAAFGGSASSSIEDIDYYEDKDNYVREQTIEVLEDTVSDGDAGTLFGTYITEMPETVVDGLYVLYFVEGMDLHKIQESLPRYIEQEDALDTYIFYMSNPESAVIAHEYYSRLTGNEFGSTPFVFAIFDGEVVYEGTYELTASSYPLRSDFVDED